MKRRRLPELADQRWCPAGLRRSFRAVMDFAADLGMYRFATPVLIEALRRSRAGAVVDLCSGGGGVWRSLAIELADAGIEVEVTPTDLFPSSGEVVGTRSVRLRRHAEPVDALDPPARFDGAFRTFFSSFHHFDEDEAVALLRAAARSGSGIAIFESTGRKPMHMLTNLIGVPLLVLLLGWSVPYSRRDVLFWTYLVPVLPLLMAWDGSASCLATYTVDELRALSRRAAPELELEIGSELIGPFDARGTWLTATHRDALASRIVGRSRKEHGPEHLARGRTGGEMVAGRFGLAP